jgi:hypothetical protein
MAQDHSFDPYGLSPEATLDPPLSLGQALLRIGPGIILAGAIVGTGELIATTHVGARAGLGCCKLDLDTPNIALASGVIPY